MFIISIRSFLIISFLFFGIFDVYSQSDKKFTFKGFIVDQETLNDVSEVHVYNQNRLGTVSDSKGYFSIPVHLNDTITFSRIDYEHKTIIIDDTTVLTDNIIRLKQKIIILDTVDIYSGIPEPSYLYRENSRPVGVQGFRMNPENNQDYHTSFGEAVSSPATALYQLFSKRYQEEKKYHELMVDKEKLDEKKTQAYENLTEYLDTQEINIKEERFDILLEFCKVKVEWLALANDYDIYLRMNSCIRKFQEEEISNQ